MATVQTQKIMETITRHFTQEFFEKELDTCLIIKEYPNKDNPYYVCLYTYPSLEQKIVNVLVTN